MRSKEDLRQEIEKLDEHYLDLVFRLLQQFPHQKKTKSKVDPITCSRSIQYVETVINGELAFTEVENSATYGKQLRNSLWQRNNTHD